MLEMPHNYPYSTAELNSSHDYLLPVILRLLENRARTEKPPLQIFELGCGNGAVANFLSEHKYAVQGVELSEEGVAQARKNYPHLQLETDSVYEDLAVKYGKFPLVLSLEVIEHLYYPRLFAKTAFDLLEPGGIAIISTPFHGYWKNLLLALSGKLDSHFTALWDGGHIKFWSKKTLTLLLLETGFAQPEFYFAGRFMPLAKSMIVVAKKPEI